MILNKEIKIGWGRVLWSDRWSTLFGYGSVL